MTPMEVAVRKAKPKSEEDLVVLEDGSKVPFSKIIAMTNGWAVNWIDDE